MVHGIPSETPLVGETGWGGEMGEERESQSQGQEISSPKAERVPRFSAYIRTPPSTLTNTHSHTHTHTHRAMLDEIVLGVCFDVYISLLSTAFIFKSRYLDI